MAINFVATLALKSQGHLASFNPVDLLVRKPLLQWTEVDLKLSVGAWKLIKQWTPAQIHELMDLYCRCWGPGESWTDEQLEWYVDIGNIKDGETGAVALPEQTGSEVVVIPRLETQAVN